MAQQYLWQAARERHLRTPDVFCDAAHWHAAKIRHHAPYSASGQLLPALARMHAASPLADSKYAAWRIPERGPSGGVVVFRLASFQPTTAMLILPAGDDKTWNAPRNRCARFVLPRPR
jgi:hypothetical protein